ncbi:YtfJ family protein [Sulfurimonas sp. CS5]|uniref:YtfJ family protein n=1 Tax=Sulfurimonas sp. CS5 TaxID=3391145 RepID=UPI0039E76E95
MKLKYFILPMILALNLSAITLGEVPKNVTIDNDNGGMVADGAAWNSSSIKDKVIVMFYIDPDEKDTNAHFSKALKEKKFDSTKFGSIAIVNLAATWKPNFVIESILKTKQKEFPNTIYVKDKNSVLVNEWNVQNDASNILLFSKNGELLFYKSGAMSEEEIDQTLKLIEKNL